MMARRKPRFRWSAILSAATTVVGILAHPEVFGFLPPPVAGAVTIAGVVLQAVTKPAIRTAEER